MWMKGVLIVCFCVLITKVGKFLQNMCQCMAQLLSGYRVLLLNPRYSRTYTCHQGKNSWLKLDFIFQVKRMVI